jgi:CubicO group peptidase (beta-lactamase class C family)
VTARAELSGADPVEVLASPEDEDLRAVVNRYLLAWPSAGLAVGLVREGRLDWFLGHGVADASVADPVTPDTVFRIASVTKTFTAIAIMQLWEQGLVDLDAPAADLLTGFRLVPNKSELAPVTIRHLLTHTSGIGYWRRLSDLFHPGVGSGDLARGPVRPLSRYYRAGLPVEVEPGTKWVYSNHGFAVLGQIVEDVTGQPIDSYLRRNVFAPLGMHDTDLTPPEPIRRARGYVLGVHGLKAVTERGVPTLAAGGAYSTAGDLARYAAALMHGGTNEHGTVLRPETLEIMFRPHFQADPRQPGMGLAFHLGEESGHRTAGHGGILPGFLSALLVAPDDHAAVIALRNTGRLDNRGAPEMVTVELLRRAIGLPPPAQIAPSPQTWHRLCGWYAPEPGPVTNLFTRATMGAGIEVAVRNRQLVMLPLTLIPGMRAGLPLRPDDPHDPTVFRADFSTLGYASPRVVFAVEAAGQQPATRLALDDIAFRRRPDAYNPRRLLLNALAATATAYAMRRILPTGSSLARVACKVESANDVR